MAIEKGGKSLKTFLKAIWSRTKNFFGLIQGKRRFLKVCRMDVGNFFFILSFEDTRKKSALSFVFFHETGRVSPNLSWIEVRRTWQSGKVIYEALILDGFEKKFTIFTLLNCVCISFLKTTFWSKTILNNYFFLASSTWRESLVSTYVLKYI